MRYRAEIDGLRAIAVVPVIFYHAGFKLFSGGFVGVDIFFVISGYLITTILIEALENGNFSITEFYEQRCRRLLPALFVILLFCFVGSWIWMIPSQSEELSRSMIATLLFVANIHFWKQTDYFAPDSDLKPLLHMWSLSVEEQFYLIFPILLLILWKIGSPRIAMIIIAAVTVASLGLSEFAWRTMPVANFYLLPTRAWELGLGALCAMWLRGRTQTGFELGAWAGIIMILLAIFHYDAKTPFPSAYALLPVLGTCCIILFASGSTLVGRFLSLRGAVGIGLISYSAYLWHQPLLAFARISNASNAPSYWVMGTLVLLSFGLAAMTWAWVEQPFRRRESNLLPGRGNVFKASILGFMVLIGIGFLGIWTNGFHSAWKHLNPESIPTLQVIETATSRPGTRISLTDCRFSVSAMTDDVVAQLRECEAQMGPAIMILGDSHSIGVYNGVILNDIFPERPVIGLNDAGCRLHSEPAICAESVLNLLENNPSLIGEIFYTQAGFHMLQTSEGRTGRDIFSGHPMETTLSVENFDAIDAHVVKVRNTLDRIGLLVPTTWIGPRIEPQLSTSLILQLGCDANYQLRPGQFEIFDQLDNRLAVESVDQPFTYSSQISATKFDMDTDFISCDAWLWRDGDHWSTRGAEIFVGRMSEQGIFSGSEVQ